MQVKKNKEWSKYRLFDKLSPYLFLAPSLLVIFLILIYPIGRSIYLSFFDLNLMRSMDVMHFVGFDNFVRLFKEPYFWQSFWITVVYTVGMAVGSFIFGLVGALILNLKFKGRSTARVLIMLPWAISPVVASLIWVWMLDKDFGVVNYILLEANVISDKVGWLITDGGALFSVIIVTIWKFAPIATVMLLAALQSIPNHLYEVARLDGASSYHQFRYITLPSIKPVSAILFNLLILWGFRRFEYIFLMTGGGPAKATETMVIKTYLEAFRNWDVGYASAIGTFTLAVALLFSVVYLKMTFRSQGGV